MGNIEEEKKYKHTCLICNKDFENTNAVMSVCQTCYRVYHIDQGVQVEFEKIKETTNQRILELDKSIMVSRGVLKMINQQREEMEVIFAKQNKRMKYFLAISIVVLALWGSTLFF